MNSHNNANPTVIQYSERGMVNELVHRLRTTGGIEAGRAFLSAIAWSGATPPLFHDAVASMRDWWVIVEPCFGQFGDPDLIIVVRSDVDGPPLVIFVEAKIHGYHQTSRTNTSDAMAIGGYNSCINGQLSLRYRLAEALQRGVHDGRIAESQDTWEAYGKTLGEPLSSARHLRKAAVIEELVKRTMGCGDGLARERTFYVALTTDDGNPFQSAPCPTVATGHDWPVYLDPSGAMDASAWARTGWLGWHQFFPSREDGSARDERGLAATMRLSIAPDPDWARSAATTPSEQPALRTLPWRDAPDPSIRERLATTIKNTAERRGLTLRTNRHEGSDTFSYRGRPVVKTMRASLKNQVVVLVGVSCQTGIDPGKAFDRKHSVNGHGFALRVVSQVDDVLRADLDEVIEKLRQRF